MMLIFFRECGANGIDRVPKLLQLVNTKAKIIAAEKYKSNSGNWTQKVTFQIDGGNTAIIMNGITYGLLMKNLKE